MYCIIQFRMLLFILTYVWCIFNVSCNNDTVKAEINNPSAGKWSTNLNTSNINVTSGEVNSNINKTKQVFFGEGGSMSSVITDKNYDSSSTSKASIPNDTLNDKILLQYDVQNGLNDSNLSSDHKPHIGRKGVDASKEPSSEEIPVERKGDETAKSTESGEKSSVATNVSTLTSSTITSQSSNFTINSTIANGTAIISTSSQENLSQSTSSSTATSNSTSSLVSRNGFHNRTIGNKLNIMESTQPPKAKPEFTRDDSDVDDNSYSLTNPENDYVIPIVATIFAAPLLIVLAMFLYKRSKEFWERRHYRRMDFLIDGMYND